MEVWKSVPIAGYGQFYEISSLGNIRATQRRKGSYITNRTLKLKPMKDGYLLARMNNGEIKGKQKYFSAHRLVAMAFLENPNNYPQVDHINGDRNDNNIENLEWVTAKENIRRAIIRNGKWFGGLKTKEFADCHPVEKAVGSKNQCKRCYMIDYRKFDKIRRTAYLTAVRMILDTLG